ncbi:17980_t:CDS:2, partial [Gigaspora margarita]
QVEDKLKAAGINTQLIKPVGRPRLEEAQSGLLETILHLVSSDGQTDERRRSEIIWSTPPKRFNTEEGKQNVKTVPVKLLRLQNTTRKRHEDTYFCAFLVRNIKEMISLLEPQSVLTIYQDDKARKNTSQFGHSKQARTNPNESKYEKAKAITYSGPMFIRICNGKHNTSTAYTHSKDFNDLMSNERLHNFTTTEDGQSKPVVLMLTNSGPDENSHDLARIILPYDTFGSHLDEQLKTADDELENHNFKVAGKILASIIKYNDTSCCRPFRSRILQLLPNQFFPLPILVQQKSYSICAASINASDNTTHFSNFLLSTLMAGKLIFLEMNLQRFPFNWYSPTINKSINEYFCTFCYQYFRLKKSLKQHIQKCPYKSSNSLMKNQVSNNKGKAIWIKENTIPKDAPESLFQEVRHIRTNQDRQAYFIDWKTWKPEWTNDE